MPTYYISLIVNISLIIYKLCYNGRIKTFSRQREFLEYIDIAYFFNSNCLLDNLKNLIKKAN